MMRRIELRAAAAALALILTGATPAMAQERCRLTPAEPGAHLTGLDRHGNPLTASGAEMRLIDLRVADIAAAEALIARERPAYRVLADAEPDRWGRLPVQAVLDDGRPLAYVLIDAGLAWVDPGPGADLCDPALLPREARARAGWRGIWAAPENRPLSAHDPGALAARAGESVIVEGRVVSIGERGRATYLDFSRRWQGGFTVIIPEEIWQDLSEKGIDAAYLSGRRIRVRGVMLDWRGPAIELAIAAFIEDLETGRSP
ncbi:MAG: thermonuclease family protein [Salinarimonas sp.]